MEIVHRHGRVWQYNFNANNSGILGLGENQQEHDWNMKNCIFKLGDAVVRERTFYEHVGIIVSLFNDDEQILKGCRTLNTISGLEIR